ncbi:MAG: DEAD/DEAH box helicase [Acinetobacter sp.]|uniref:DEAD/DEAH box helicase n=1 Tax=Acinetobacter sp. TaxID=472 RepID=UPI000FB80721|nr:DEAD/DEAH box helicase [Acinetobacter sp.]RUP39793.1 MAG: DEAD/DEAH box helicase [Acinetobacter sp.]
MRYQPHPYQQHAEEHVMQNPEAGLFIDMGLGKTVTTLTAINRMLYEDFEITKVLVIAPKRVAEDTWITETQKWDHLKHLKLSLVLGSEPQRVNALRAKADIYVINRENVAWLVAYLQGAFPFDALVIDELSSFKNSKSVRFKALRTVRPLCKRVIGLTGTPAPNGFLDLWPQLYLLDQGKRLGKTITGFRENYFVPGKRNGHVVYEYNLRKDKNVEKEIFEKIGDICISMKAEDYLQLPERIDRDNWITLSPKAQQMYNDFERDLILNMPDEEEITAVNAAALTNKLLQFANGAVYDTEKNWHEFHTAKLEALAEDVEAANGKPVLVLYNFKHDLERIMRHFKTMKPKLIEGAKDVKDWNEGKIPFLLGHPASMGHGLNMQAGGHLMFWFGLPWSLELYQQAVKRLDRQGQLNPVINSRLLVRNTVDEDVLAAQAGKANVQDSIMNAVKAIIKKYR